MIVRKCDMKIGSFRCRALALTPKAEHACLVAYSSAEIFGLHAAMWWVSVGLTLFGMGSIAASKLIAAATDGE